MVIVTGELDYIKSNWISRMKVQATNIQVGDSNTPPSTSDVATGNLLIGGTTTIESLNESVVDQLSFSAKYGITSFVGSTVNEATLFDGTNIKTRNLTVSSLKGADQIFWPSITVKITASNV